jgi:hypothetical protein
MIEENVDRRTREINTRYPDLREVDPDTLAVQSIFSEATLGSEPDLQGLAEWIHFERHKIPLKVDQHQMDARDWNASCRVQRTVSDLEQIRCERGPIKPFKGNLEHSTIFEALWGLGIERLTQEELADFFDRYCTCGLEAHDPDSIKKTSIAIQKNSEETARKFKKRSIRKWAS